MNEVLNFIQPKDAWDKLSMREKAEMMKVAVRNGIYNLNDIREKYNEFAEGGDTEEKEEKENSYSVRNMVKAIYQTNPKDEYLGEPSHHHAVIKPEYIGLSEEELDRLVGKKDKRGHRLDIVKSELHPSHPSRGTWNRNKFALTELGMQDPNYTMFGLVDGNQDPQAVLTYKGGVILPEITVTPQGNYFFNSYDNIELHTKAHGGSIHIKHPGRLTALKKRTGKSEAELYRTGSPATRKMITFARNARKWKHGNGGPLINLFYPGGYVRSTNDHPVAFDREGNLVDQVTGEKGTMMLPEVTVTGRNFTEPYYSTKDDAAPIRNLFSIIQEVADTPIMVQQNPGTATGYSSYGQYMPKSQSTYGDQADLLLTELTAPTVLSDAKGIYQVFRHPVQTAKAVRSIFSEGAPAAEWAIGRTAPQITTENAASITRYDLPSSDIIIESSTSANPNIPFDEAWLAASKGRHQMSNLVGSDDYAGRVRQAYQDNGIPVNQADFEILQAKQGIEDSNLKVVPNLKSTEGEALNGQYDSNTGQILVSQDRENILDVVESSGHEHAHASEVDRLLELLKEKWKHIKPRKEAFTRSDGSVDTEWKDYISKIVEMRAPAMSVWSEMKDLGFSKVGDYLHHLKRFGLEDKQWEALVNRYGLTNAKYMVETVFGVSPFVISGVNNEEKDSTTM